MPPCLHRFIERDDYVIPPASGNLCGRGLKIGQCGTGRIDEKEAYFVIATLPCAPHPAGLAVEKSLHRVVAAAEVHPERERTTFAVRSACQASVPLHPT